MERHVTALGILFVIGGLLGLIGMAVVLFIFVGGGIAGSILAAVEAAAASDSGAAGASVAALMAMALGLFLTFIIGLTTIPSLIAGYGLLTRRTWSPILALIVGILSLPSFPVGTLIGIYAIWVYVQEGTAAVMVSRQRAAVTPSASPVGG